MKKVIILLSIFIVGFSTYAFMHIEESAGNSMTDQAAFKKWEQAKPSQALFHSGDLIFRHGRGFISEALMQFSRRESKYSHAGIISIENEKVFVYHAIGGEENKTNKLRKDPITLFCNPNQVYSFGIYRTDLSLSQLTKLDSIAKNYFNSGLEFDTKFEMDTDDKMYCSEFVYKAIGQATGEVNYLPLSSVPGKIYVGCDDLYLNSHCFYLYSYQY